MLTIVALLIVRGAEAFDHFERQTARIIKAYGDLRDSAFRFGCNGF